MKTVFYVSLQLGITQSSSYNCEIAGNQLQVILEQFSKKLRYQEYQEYQDYQEVKSVRIVTLGAH